LVVRAAFIGNGDSRCGCAPRPGYHAARCIESPAPLPADDHVRAGLLGRHDDRFDFRLREEDDEAWRVTAADREPGALLDF
jgi:hypothetical protein